MKPKRKGSPDYREQKNAFDFLQEKYNKQELFTKKELEKAAGWDPAKNTFNTYFTKQFEGLLVPYGDRYRVSQLFLQYNKWNKFRDSVVSQNRILRRDYTTASYENVVRFEFFLPLKNEASLRMALDSLFFKDSIRVRLDCITPTELNTAFPKKDGEADEAYFNRIYDWVSKTFGGYSISHVAGRFRAEDLRTRKEVYEAAAAANAQSYLVDETAAVVLFIIPCGGHVENHFLALGNNVQMPLHKDAKLENEARMIRWFFYALFVSSITELVNGEDQIWLLESGMHNQLHVWKVKD